MRTLVAKYKRGRRQPTKKPSGTLVPRFAMSMWNFATSFWTRGALPVNNTQALMVNNTTPTFTLAGGLKTKGSRPMLADAR